MGVVCKYLTTNSKHVGDRALMMLPAFGYQLVPPFPEVFGLFCD
jgi:hypothetical protein